MVGWGSTRLAGGVYARAGSPPRHTPPALPPPVAAADTAAEVEARIRNMGAELARDIAKALTLNPDELLLTGRGRIAAVHEEAPARGGEAMICPGRGRRPKGGTAEV